MLMSKEDRRALWAKSQRARMDHKECHELSVEQVQALVDFAEELENINKSLEYDLRNSLENFWYVMCWGDGCKPFDGEVAKFRDWCRELLKKWNFIP